MKRSDLKDKCVILVDLQEGNRSKETNFTFNRILELFVNNYLDHAFATKFVCDVSSLPQEDARNRFVSPRSHEIPEYILQYLSNIFLHSQYQFVDTDFLYQLRIFNGGQLPDTVYIIGFDVEGSILSLCLGLQRFGIRPVVIGDYVSSYTGLDMVGAGMRIIRRLCGSDSILWIDK